MGVIYKDLNQTIKSKHSKFIQINEQSQQIDKVKLQTCHSNLNLQSKTLLSASKQQHLAKQRMNTSTQGYKRQYLTKSGTFQHVFCIFIWYLIFALPFYFSFGGEKFWLKPKNQMLSCQYNYTGYYALQVNYISNNTWTSQEYSNIVGSSMKSLSGLSSFSVEDNIESSTVSFSLTNFGQKQVQDINLILYFKIWISELEKEISATYVQNINGDLSYAEMLGVLRYQPESQLNDIDNRKTLNYPAYLPNLQPPTSFDALMGHIIDNHEVHRLNQQVMQTSVSSQASATRNMKIKLIKDTKVNIPYYPSVLETLKFAFSKWLAFTIIAYFVFFKLLEKLVKDGAIVTKIKDEIIS